MRRAAPEMGRTGRVNAVVQDSGPQLEHLAASNKVRNASIVRRVIIVSCISPRALTYAVATSKASGQEATGTPEAHAAR
jgi:hypothetical protein